MRQYTGWEYLLIDAANNFNLGLDKQIFEDRITWALTNLTCLEALADGQVWKNKPQYLKAVQTIRKAQQGEVTGHLVGLDATCSGMQIMSVLTGCHSGANATGLVDPNRRADAYMDCTTIMGTYLGKSVFNVRDKVKQAVMTALYGSRKEPRELFGDDTPELQAFYRALWSMAPGACRLLQALIDSWDPNALVHSCKLPDGFDMRVKVMVTHHSIIEVDELAHSTFLYAWQENKPLEYAVKNAANVVHALDGYILRSMIRRCNYERERAEVVYDILIDELLDRLTLSGPRQFAPILDNPEAAYYVDQYNRSGMADITILPYLCARTVESLSDAHVKQLRDILASMLEHPSFELITVHDAFYAHPNNLNAVRMHYRNILAELADSNVLNDLLSQLYHRPVTFQKESPDLSKYIRQSAYALC